MESNLEGKKGVFFSVEQVSKNFNPNYLRFLGRWQDKSKMDLTIEVPFVYFYILKSEIDKVNFKCSLKEGFKSIFGDELVKVTMDNPWNIYKVKNNFSKTFEADIPAPTRYLIDFNLYDGISIKDNKIISDEIEVEPRISIIDIETDYSGGSNKEMTRPIIAISFYDSYDKKIRCISYSNDEQIYSKSYISIRKELKLETPIEQIIVKDEIELLSLLKKYIITLDFDIFTGWNVNFDMIYILHRLNSLNLNPEELSPVNKIYYVSGDICYGTNKRLGEKKNEKRVMIRGRNIIDLMAGYRRMKWKSIPSFALDAVSESEFKSGKIEYNGWIHDFWIKDYKTFLEYNIKDVEICIALNNKYNILNSLLGIKKMSGCELSDILHNSRIIDVYILRNCKNKFILPTRTFNNSKEKIEGGFVLEPRSGISKNIVVLDLKSLYPSLMLAANMSPETVKSNGEINIGNGVRFSKETGILKQILIDLLKKRDDIRLMLKTPEVNENPDLYLTLYKKQYYYKTFMNSYYGAQLYPGFRLFNPNIGSSITFLGRFTNSKMRELCKSKGYEVITADTDSVYVDVHEKDITKAILIGKELEKEINNSFEEWYKDIGLDNSFMSIKFEKLYGIYCNAGEKKCYAGKIFWDWEKGLLEKPDIEVKGFATVKTDRSIFSRRIQRTIINMILEEKGNIDILNYLYLEIDKFLNKEYSSEEMGIPKQISKDLDEYEISNPWIKGVKFSLENINGYTFSPKPYMIYVKKGKYKTESVCFNSNNQFTYLKDLEIDWFKMAEASITHVLEGVLSIKNIKIDIIHNYIKNKISGQKTLF